MRSYTQTALLFIVAAHTALAQAGRPAGGSGSSDRIQPVTGSVLRKNIPNEYLEVNVTRGVVHLVGGASDLVEWKVATSTDSIPGLPISLPVRVTYAAGYPGTVGTTTWTDHFTLDIGPVLRQVPAKLQADLRLSVPRSLRLLHITVHGSGKVIVDGFDGELTVAVDSGSITASGVNGATLLEARNGGVALDLSGSAFQTGPVSVMSHNGSIDLTLPPNPSATVQLSTDCGEINSPFSLTPPKSPSSSRSAWMDPQYAGQQGDCSLRPKSLPPLEGVARMRGFGEGTLGGGAITIRAKALQGDINIKRKPPGE